MKNGQVVEIEITKFSRGNPCSKTDFVAVEEPLEIQILYSTSNGRMQKNVSVTMRTPGNDDDLAAGFLFTEGIITDLHAVDNIKRPSSDENRILVILKQNIIPVLKNADRNFYSTSSCGICGKASIEAIRIQTLFKQEKDDICVEASTLYRLHAALLQQQELFETTGGIHASALFDLKGNFIMLREDVGRHNALDKVIGAALLKKELPLSDCILLLSGRASFELLQKAAMAGIKIVVAVGAPSSLAVEMARDAGITLAGFLKGDRFNLYTGAQRISE